ncbi:pyruvate/2-oxoacid:ferredoxin oxidoreductase beta subunit [Clostridium beijerinckii]|nr:pyruvate/2-oxoacid:ferredoxin oxidoreductase beta subunit [Clostridium beijerinckii]OOM42376.1 hypothetical protein CBEIJ_43240 [Clostridium beijerinckii]
MMIVEKYYEWANSLFKDNAEFDFGMRLEVKTIREKIANNCLFTIYKTWN